jgi:hypothetical protein
MSIRVLKVEKENTTNIQDEVSLLIDSASDFFHANKHKPTQMLQLHGRKVLLF